MWLVHDNEIYIYIFCGNFFLFEVQIPAGWRSLHFPSNTKPSRLCLCQEVPKPLRRPRALEKTVAMIVRQVADAHTKTFQTVDSSSTRYFDKIVPNLVVVDCFTCLACYCLFIMCNGKLDGSQTIRTLIVAVLRGWTRANLWSLSSVV